MSRANEPVIEVGILFEPKIEFEFVDEYRFQGAIYKGRFEVQFQDGKILFDKRLYRSLLFEPVSQSGFTLYDVTIGIDFHWERKEDQRFEGALKIIVEDEKLTAINRIGVESYMASVISSEMSATASKEFLKAHAVISRSWLLAQVEKKEGRLLPASYLAVRNDVGSVRNDGSPACNDSSSAGSEGELIKWYDREDHLNFDVCADDHCQRYQGVTKAGENSVVDSVIEETRGEVLVYDGKICDARFSKCCGGVFEEFQYAWEDIRYPYLIAKRDSGSTKSASNQLPDLTIEEEAEKWILSSPKAYCNTTDKEILSQVLMSYDQETLNFYRWKVEYDQEYLADLIRRKSGIDFGKIIDLQPLSRGTSGRLWRLRIVGTKKSLIIGKELEIRRTLSESHLYSSAFVVRKEGEGSVPSKFTLIGAGWGHGVGLCQIGAAVMGEKGISYDKILAHYFAGSNIEKKY